MKEDAIVIESEMEGSTHVFGVFDGHGGKEVAKVVSKQLVGFLRSNKHFKAKEYAEALVDSFLKLD